MVLENLGDDVHHLTGHHRSATPLWRWLWRVGIVLLLPLDLLRHLFLRLSDWRHGCVDGTLFSLFWNELLIFSGAWSDADGRIWAHETEEILFVVQDQAFVDLELLWFSDQEFLCFGFHLFKPFHSLIVAAFLVVLTLARHLASELQEVYVHPGTNLGLFEESGHDVLALSYAFTASFEVLLVHARSVLGHTSETHFLVLPGPEADEGVLVGRIRFLLEQPQERSLFSLSLLHPPLVYLLDDLNDREFDVDALKVDELEAVVQRFAGLVLLRELLEYVDQLLEGLNRQLPFGLERLEGLDVVLSGLVIHSMEIYGLPVVV